MFVASFTVYIKLQTLRSRYTYPTYSLRATDICLWLFFICTFLRWEITLLFSYFFCFLQFTKKAFVTSKTLEYSQGFFNFKIEKLYQSLISS